MILRDYQRELVEQTAKALKRHGNSLAIAPTGAGKTIILSALVGLMQPVKSLVIAHRDELTAQNLAKFRKVNPGLPVSVYDANTKSWRGSTTTTFGMVQTICKDKNLLRMPPFHLVVIDEAHHSPSVSYQKILNRAKELNPDVMIAGFTATPERSDRRGLRSTFSNVAGTVDIKDLINRGFLVRPKAFVIDAGSGIRDRLSKVKKVHGEYDMHAVEEIMNVKVVNDEVVRHWKEKAGDRKTIIFCSTVAHARDVAETFAQAGVAIEVVTGELSRIDRAGVYRRFKSGETRVLSTVSVLTEGWDEPSASCAILLRPCSAKSVMLQMIGRILRIVNPDEYPGLIKRDAIVLDFGQSVTKHGSIDAGTNIEDMRGSGEAPFKVCPEEGDTTDYFLPDGNGNYGCGAKLPTSTKTCPLCGFEFDRPSEAPVEEVVLTEFELISQSPFRWSDVFGSQKVMVANGFNAFVTVCSPDGENWYALGGESGSRILKKITIGDRTQALAMADDFLREREDSKSAKKSARWMKDPSSDKQKELLRRFGYDIGPMDFSLDKYTAGCHITFQLHRRQIEHALFNGATPR